MAKSDKRACGCECFLHCHPKQINRHHIVGFNLHIKIVTLGCFGSEPPFDRPLETPLSWVVWWLCDCLWKVFEWWATAVIILVLSCIYVPIISPVASCWVQIWCIWSKDTLNFILNELWIHRFPLFWCSETSWFYGRAYTEGSETVAQHPWISLFRGVSTVPPDWAVQLVGPWRNHSQQRVVDLPSDGKMLQQSTIDPEIGLRNYPKPIPYEDKQRNTTGHSFGKLFFNAPPRLVDGFSCGFRG